MCRRVIFSLLVLWCLLLCICVDLGLSLNWKFRILFLIELITNSTKEKVSMKSTHGKNASETLDDNDMDIPKGSMEVVSSGVRSESGEYSGKRIKNTRSRSFVKWSLYFISFALVVGVVTIAFLKFYIKEVELPKPMASISQETRDSAACESFVALDVKCKVEWVLDENISRGGYVAKEVSGDRGSVILRYSAGPTNPVMPVVEGLTLKDAELTLWRAGLSIGNAIEKEGPAQRNVVLGSAVKSGVKLKNGDSVDLYVSMGVMSVPDWRGKPLDLVEIEAKELGFTLKINRVSSNKPDGTVVGHVGYKKVVGFGSTIELNVSSEVEKPEGSVIFPNLVGLSQVDAVATLAAKGFTKIVTNYADIEGDGKVIATFPVAGESASPTDTVVLTLTKKP